MAATATYSVLESTTQAVCNTTRDEEGVLTRTLSRTFNAVVTSQHFGQDPLQVETDLIVLGEIPAPGASHPLTSYLYVAGISTNRVSPTYYEISVDYQQIPGFDDDGGSPLEQPAEIEFFTLTTDEAIDTDYNGNALMNAGTGEPIQGVSIPVSDLAVRAKKYIVTFNPIAFYGYINTTNSDTFLSFPPGTARIHDISASRVRQQGFDVWDITVEIQFRQPFRVPATESWYKRIKAEGLKVWKADVSKIVDARTDAANDAIEEGTLSPNPVLINKDTGERLAEGEAAQWKTWQVFGTSSFSSLGLDL